MLGRKDFTGQELDDAQANVKARLKAFRLRLSADVDRLSTAFVTELERKFVAKA
jgi:hypothetical protein